MLRSGQKWSLASRADRGLRCTLGKTSAPFGATHARGEGARPERSGIQSVAVGGSPSIKYDESHHTAPELEDRHRCIPRVRSPARATPRPRTRRHRGSTWVRSPILYRIFRPTARPRGSGSRPPARPRRCRSDLRSGSPTPYTCDVGTCTAWTDTSAVRSLTHTEQRNRCGLAALSTRDSPRSSCVAVARPPAGLRIDFGQAGPDAEHTPIPVTGFPEEVRGRRPSYRGPNRAHVCRVDQWKRAREWNSYR